MKSVHGSWRCGEILLCKILMSQRHVLRTNFARPVIKWYLDYNFIMWQSTLTFNLIEADEFGPVFLFVNCYTIFVWELFSTLLKISPKLALSTPVVSNLCPDAYHQMINNKNCFPPNGHLEFCLPPDRIFRKKLFLKY
jgi:hypothetical protein